MIKTIIVSMDKNGLIGKSNQLPWKISEELQFFKRTTMGFPVIMGKKTWDSLPKKPLPGRFNIVLSRDYQFSDSDVVFVNNIDDAIYIASWRTLSKAFIIGGAKIYDEFLKNNLVDSIIVSRVKGEYEGDTYFPDVLHSWKKEFVQEYEEFSVYEYKPVEKV